MDGTLKDSESSTTFGDLPEAGYPGPLNHACLLSDGDLLFDDKNTAPVVLVPETPSPRYLRHRRRCPRATENRGHALLPSPPLNGEEQSSCGATSPPRKFKRRKLNAAAATSTLSGADPSRSTLLHTNRLFFSSSLVENNVTPSNLLEPPLSTTFSSLPSFSAPPATQKVKANDRFGFDTQTSVVGSTVEPSVGRLKKPTPKRAAPAKSSSKSFAYLSSCSNVDSLSFLTSEEKEWVNSDSKITHLTAVQKMPQCDEIVISDEENDIVQAVVRSAQMEEDEAFAHSLQTQFDREQHQQQEHQLQEATSDHFRNYLVDRRRRGRGLNQRSHRRNSHLSIPTEFDVSQGNDYEALLAFEERQGAVVSKNTMTRREIERLPTKSYVSSHSAGKTQCQICFSDYSEGEQLRMLPCLHDYHVQCIDRWLTKNVTCPICRADISQSTGFADPV